MPYLFQDYETFNLSPLGGAPSQYAAIGTNDNFDVQVTENFFCLPAADTMPDIHACLVTKQTPNSIMTSGNALSEYDFVSKINKLLLADSGTIVVGYNSLRFDDEWNRHLLYRNLYPAYDWHFKNGNSRYDAILLMRATFALRPHLLNWHYVEKQDDSGDLRVSMKLEDLSKVNGIFHENAHDALADVYALIELMKKIKDADPEFYSAALKINNKHHVNAILQKESNKNGLIYISPYESEHNFIGYVIPLFKSKEDSNVFWAWDAKVNPNTILKLEEQDKKNLLSLKKDELEKLGITKKGLIKISLNKLPNLFEKELYKREFAADSSLSDLRPIISENIKLINEKMSNIRDLVELVEGNKPTFDECVDSDMGLYSSGFMSKQESSFISRFSKLKDWKSRYDLIRNDSPSHRISSIGMRILGRNCPDILEGSDKELWELYVNSRFVGIVDNTPMDNGERMTATKYIDKLREFINEVGQGDVELKIAQELLNYYQKKQPPEDFIEKLSKSNTVDCDTFEYGTSII